MCRSKRDGGARCGDPVECRRRDAARKRACYAAAVAARTMPGPTLDRDALSGGSATETGAPTAAPTALLTTAAVPEALPEALAALSQAGHSGSDTDIEAAARQVGALVWARAQERVHQVVAAVDDRCAAVYGVPRVQDLRAGLQREVQSLEGRLAVAQAHTAALNPLKGGNTDQWRAARAVSKQVEEEVRHARLAVIDLDAGQHPWQVERDHAETTAVRQVLAEIRPMGRAEDLPEDFFDTEWSTSIGVTAVRDAVTFYPKDWLVDGAGRRRGLPLMVSESAQRSRFNASARVTDRSTGAQHYVSRILVPEAEEAITCGGRVTRQGTTIHEFGHYVEDRNPALHRATRAFLDRRCGNSPAQPLGPGMDGEEARPGGFAAPYIGKTCQEGASEVLSTGMEALFGGGYGRLRGADGYRADREHRDLVLGLLAGL